MAKSYEGLAVEAVEICVDGEVFVGGEVVYNYLRGVFDGFVVSGEGCKGCELCGAVEHRHRAMLFRGVVW